jgi:hypothetical protein
MESEPRAGLEISLNEGQVLTFENFDRVHSNGALSKPDVWPKLQPQERNLEKSALLNNAMIADSQPSQILTSVIEKILPKALVAVEPRREITKNYLETTDLFCELQKATNNVKNSLENMRQEGYINLNSFDQFLENFVGLNDSSLRNEIAIDPGVDLDDDGQPLGTNEALSNGVGVANNEIAGSDKPESENLIDDVRDIGITDQTFFWSEILGECNIQGWRNWGERLSEFGGSLWRGKWILDGTDYDIDKLNFSIGADGVVWGAGEDANGKFRIMGQIDGEANINFVMVYSTPLPEEETAVAGGGVGDQGTLQPGLGDAPGEETATSL